MDLQFHYIWFVWGGSKLQVWPLTKEVVNNYYLLRRCLLHIVRYMEAAGTNWTMFYLTLSHSSSTDFIAHRSELDGGGAKSHVGRGQTGLVRGSCKKFFLSTLLSLSPQFLIFLFHHSTALNNVCRITEKQCLLSLLSCSQDILSDKTDRLTESKTVVTVRL